MTAHRSKPTAPHSLRATAAVVMCIMLSAVTHAQDQHFSMLDLDPMLFNPAYSGFYDGLGRFGLVYRNQWASVSTPFQTISATAEWGLLRSRRNMNGFNAGLWLTADRAGTLNYGSTSASAVLSYFQGIGDGSNIISIAAEVGIGQAGFNTDDISLYDPTETFDRASVPYPTLGAGVAWFYEASDIFYTKFGISVRNINQPDISYNSHSDSRLAAHYNIYGRAEWRMLPRWGIMPLVGFQRQNNYNELVYGCDVRYYVHERQDYLVFGGGLSMRHNDAICANICILWHDLTFAIGYDANISRLSAASHTIGAFEVGLVYMLGREDSKRTTSIPCPIF